jgi:hypothetical protein
VQFPKGCSLICTTMDLDFQPEPMRLGECVCLCVCLSARKRLRGVWRGSDTDNPLGAATEANWRGHKRLAFVMTAQQHPEIADVGFGSFLTGFISAMRTLCLTNRTKQGPRVLFCMTIRTKGILLVSSPE